MDISALKSIFSEQYGTSEKPVKIYFAPGRVNLIGEHTDYNGGYVFPCALSFGTYLLVRMTDDSNIRFRSTNLNYTASIPVAEISEKKGTEWVNYPLGVMNQLTAKGIEFQGMELLYSGNIPNGAGLSSSASIEMVTAVAMNDMYGSSLEMMDMVKLSQKAENEFVGVNCGIMDQFASGMGEKDHALALKCDTLEFEAVPIVLEGYKIVIANTNKRRGLADSKYNERRSECDKAVEYISKEKPINLLGDIDLAAFEKLQDAIPDETVKRRARHVVSENQRVIDALEALKTGDLKFFGSLMNASHDSLRDDYEVTGVELDTMVDEARKIDGVIGSRMTGAGFGGCTVNIVREDTIDTFKEQVGKNYKEKTSLQADFYIADIGDGAKRIE
jgi:galactokinase